MFIEDLYKDKKLLDFSNYLKDAKYYNGVKNNVIGKMTNKTRDMPIKRFAELKSTMYAFITEDNQEFKEKEKALMKLLLVID